MKTMLPVRRLIPKWRAVSKTLDSGEVSPAAPAVKQKLVVDPSELEAALREWKARPGVGQLGDVLALSVFPEFADDVMKVAQEARALGVEMTTAQRTLTKIVQEPYDEALTNPNEQCNPGAARIRLLRASLKENPANPLALFDLAQLKLAWGDRRSADRALRTAMTLMPDSALALRTYARYLVHIGEKERAHTLIRRHPRTSSNPWLMASEIALAQVADRSPAFFTAGRRMVKEGRLPASQLTELAGALGTQEQFSGRYRLARSFFLAALQSPNDNVAAQVITDEQTLGISLDSAAIRTAIQATSEASAIAAFHRGEVKAAIRAADHWFGEEPFSSRPVQLLGVLHMLEDDFDSAAKIIACGLRADPDDVNLLINQSYALAASGRASDAIAAGRKALSKDRNASEPFYKATLGLLLMQEGLFDEGAAMYDSAAERFGRMRDKQREALCSAYKARSAVMTGHPDALRLVDEALQAASTSPSLDGALILSKLTGNSKLPNRLDANRRTEQWIYHPSTNILEKKNGLTARGAPAIVWAD